MNKLLTLSALALTATASVFAQSGTKGSSTWSYSSSADSKDAIKKQSRGIRFVVRNLSTESVSQLYALTGDKDNPVVNVRLGSRQPSKRLTWDANRQVSLYKDEPLLDASGKLDKEKLPTPFLTAQIPDEMSSKVLGMIVLTKDPKNNRVFYMDENIFKKGGIHAVNLTASPIKISISESGDYKKDGKHFVLQPFHSGEGITKKNSWNFNPSLKESSKIYHFSITATGADGKEQKIRSSQFIVAQGVSQINLFVRGENGRIAMSSVSLGE